VDNRDATDGRETRTSPLSALAAALVFCAALWGPGRLGTPSQPFEIDPDEGGNLMKALLVGDGVAPWTDQPPFMPWLWSLGGDVAVGRVLTAIIVTLGVACAGAIAARTAPEGRRSAILVGVVVGAVCAAWPGMLVASRALLIGLPSLALSTAAAGVALGSRRHGWLAAPLAAAAVATKLVALVPLVALVLALSVHRRPGRGRLAVFLGSVVGAAVAFAVGGASLASVHLDAQRSLAGVGASLGEALSPGAALLLPTCAVAPLLVRRGAVGLWAATFLAGACAFVALQTPRWWHHSLVVGLAVAVVAGVVVGSAMTWALGPRRRAAAVVAVAGVVLVVVGGGIALSLPATDAALRALDGSGEGACSPSAASSALALLSPGVVVTDRPMVAARAGHRAPPGLAVVSLKRRAAGLTTSVLVEEMEGAATAGTLRGVYLERFPWPGVEGRLPAGQRQEACPAGIVFSRE